MQHVLHDTLLALIVQQQRLCHALLTGDHKLLSVQVQASHSQYID